MDRRIFLKRAAWSSLVLANPGFPLYASANEPEFAHLTILHTNDVHSRIDPFPMDGGRNQGLGGVAKRASMIARLRKQNKNVLLLDAGDIFQGTPYFNFFGGELEMKLMSQMNYDISTMGNHDFDAGIDGFEKQMKHANFPFVVANYDFSNTVLDGKVEPYKIFEIDGLKIGVLGLGIELKGLVPKVLYGETQYSDPIPVAQKYATLLKQELKCDYVICLSHLGYKYREGDKISDVHVSQATSNIDLFIGGHTHSFMKTADVRRNKDGKEVLVSQAGWAGILLGRIDVSFERTNGKKCITCKNSVVK